MTVSPGPQGQASPASPASPASFRGVTALVTGGAGFIGSHIARALVERGARVRVLDDLSTGRRENLAEVAGDIELVTAPVQDPGAADAAVRGVELVFHEGALPSVARSMEEPLASHDANATGTLTLVDACRRAGVGRLVYAGSSSAYGNTEVLPTPETVVPDPLSPYAASKLAGEHYVRLGAKAYGLHAVVLRYFNVFGPRQDPLNPYAAVIAKFIALVSEGRRPVIFGDGLQSRDFVYIADVVEANLLAATAGPHASGQVYNVACGERRTLLDLVAALNRIFGTRLDPIFEPPRAGDVRHSVADIARARRDLGYAPRTSFEEGLRLTAAG